jgi:hypothetical protein
VPQNALHSIIKKNHNTKYSSIGENELVIWCHEQDTGQQQARYFEPYFLYILISYASS